MIKIVTPSSFNFDQPVMQLMDVHSQGIDSSWLRKSAAVLTKELSDLRPEKGVTFTHLLALGDRETYGCNRNGDCFPKSACESHHGTFVKHAKWFHNHKNKPHRGDPAFGFVKHSAYNPEMHRVELIVGIYDDKDPDSIQKLASGDDIPVSMACLVPEDECTICGNRAKSTDKYCECLKKHATQILEDGQQVGMINWEPDWFDISKVHRNADRIAFTLGKVASVGGQPIVFSADAATQMGLTLPNHMIKDASYSRRLDLVYKLAEMEKEIEGEMTNNPGMKCVADKLGEPMEKAPEKVPDEHLRTMLGGLASAKVSLTLEDFLKLVMGSRSSEVAEHIPDAKIAMASVYSDACGCPEDLVSGSENYEPLDLPMPNMIKKAVRDARNAALEEGSLQGRLTVIALRKKASLVVPYENRSKRTPSRQGKELAKEYARYKLAFLNRVEDPFVTRLSVLQNFSGGIL